MHVVAILFRLAWRNLWRNRRRTGIMLAAIVVGTWAMIFMTALMRGMVNEMVKDGIEALPGHVQVHHPAFRDDPSIANLLPIGDGELEQRFEAAGLGRGATRVRVPAVVTSEYDSRGVTLLGIDPEAEAGMTFVDEDEVEGRFLDGVNDSGIVIGARLADTLETGLGKRVVVMTQDPDNEIADRGFRIVGLFSASVAAVEEAYVFIGKGTAQELLGIGDAVSEAFFVGPDYRHVEDLRARVAAALDERVVVEAWYEVDSYLATMLGVMDGFALVWIIVIFLALSFGLVNTLVMAVFERVREIGLMLALGMRPRNILGQVVIESLLLLVIGLATGTLLSWLTVLPLDDGIDISAVGEGMEMWGVASTLYPELAPGDVVLANVVVLVLGFLASLSPAWRAAHYEPVAAMRKI